MSFSSHKSGAGATPGTARGVPAPCQLWCSSPPPRITAPRHDCRPGQPRHAVPSAPTGASPRIRLSGSQPSLLLIPSPCLLPASKWLLPLFLASLLLQFGDGLKGWGHPPQHRAVRGTQLPRGRREGPGTCAAGRSRHPEPSAEGERLRGSGAGNGMREDDSPASPPAPVNQGDHLGDQPVLAAATGSYLSPAGAWQPPAVPGCRSSIPSVHGWGRAVSAGPATPPRRVSGPGPGRAAASAAR